MDGARRALACVMLLCAGAATAADTGFYFGVLGGATKYDFARPSFPYLAFPSAAIVPPTIGSFENFAAGVGIDNRFVTGAVYSNYATFVTPVFGPTIAAPWGPHEDDEATAWGIFGGYRIVRFAAVELSYLNLGKLESSYQIQPPVFYPDLPVTSLKRELKTTGPTFSVLGILPITDRWDVYARAGVLFADMESKTAFNGRGESTTFGSKDPLWGLGTQLDAGQHWSMRVDFQRFESVGSTREAGEADIDLMSLQVLYRL